MNDTNSSLIYKRHFITWFVPTIVISVGILVLIGWQFGIIGFTKLFPGITAMNPMTAISFLLAGLALWMVSTGKSPYLARAFAMLVIVLALLKLGDVFLGWNIGVDRLLFAEKLLAEDVPNRMAPNTAVNFLLVGAAIYLTSHNTVRRSKLVQILITVVAFISFLAVIGYVHNVVVFYEVNAYIPMALNTAATFLFLCAGILTVQPDVGVMALWRSPTMGGVLVRREIPLAAIALFIMGSLETMGVKAGIFDSELGESLFTLINISLMSAGVAWSAMAVNRAEHKRMETEITLRESEMRYRSLFEDSSDAIFISDDQGRYCDANQQAQRLTGFTYEEILAKRAGDFALNPEDGRAAYTAVRNEGQQQTDYLIRRKDGTELAVLIYTRKIMPTLYQTIMHDISDLKKSEENLRRALEQERKLSELKSHFVSMVSHEFRTPLAVIQSSTDLLLHYDDRMNAAKRQERLEKIQMEVNHLVQMLGDMLILRKAETVGVEFHPESLDLCEFCTSLVAEVQSTTATHRIIFTSDGSCSNAYIDPRLLRQAIINLLTNAVKYSPGRDHVNFELVCSESEIVLQVQDQGIGIPKEDLENVFDVFHRGRNVAGINGTGLGLPIVKQAVDAHGGAISLVSEKDLGTIFTIQLPRLLPA